MHLAAIWLGAVSFMLALALPVLDLFTSADLGS
jgi:hypothetical protein